MAKPDKRPVTMEELLVSSLAQTDALAKLRLRGADYARRVHAEDFGGTGDVSEAAESHGVIRPGRFAFGAPC
jgi:hypothetical protein